MLLTASLPYRLLISIPALLEPCMTSAVGLYTAKRSWLTITSKSLSLSSEIGVIDEDDDDDVVDDDDDGGSGTADDDNDTQVGSTSALPSLGQFLMI